MHGRITTLGVVLGLFISGCQSAEYVTRAEFDAWKAANEAQQQADLSGGNHGAAVTRLYSTLKGVKQAVDITSKNLANAETIGYKTLRVRYVEDGAAAYGVSDFTIGSPRHTGADLDLMIQGDGFFRVAYPHHPQGVAYTRAGNFYRNIDGDLVLGGSQGLRLEPVINLPEGITALSISEDGVISGYEPGAVTPTEFGQIELTSFSNPRVLTRIDGGLFVQSYQSGPPIFGCPGEGTMGTLLHRFLESSNVDTDMEMATLTKLNWRYEETMHAIRMLGSRRVAGPE